jgi:predicted MFS family arabinose efflux permease
MKRRIVWVAFAVAVFGWGIGFYGPAVYLPTLHQTRGWPIAIISAAITAHYLVSAALILALPEIHRRIGVGRTTFAGVLLASLGAIAWGNASALWHLIPALLLSGAGWAATSGAALNAIVAPWLDQDRPKAIGLAFNGASVGGLIFAPLWTVLIARYGLGPAAVFVSFVMVGVLCPLIRRFLWQAPAVSSAPSPRRQLVRQGRFIALSAAFALGLFAQIGLFAHLLARLGPSFGPVLAASAISLVTLCAVPGRTVLGRLIGARDRRLAAALKLGMQAGGSVLLAVGEGAVVLGAGCVLFGLGVGNLTSLPPLIAQREYRPADVGTVVALVIATNQAVFAFAPAVFGWLHDLTTGYGAAFTLAAAVQATAAVVIAAGRRFS